MLGHLYFNQISGACYRTTYSIEKTHADIIIIGSSRAQHHYIPKIFTAVLGLSCYNTGRDGQSIPYFFAIFRAITKRYTPRIVIIDLPMRLTHNHTDFSLSCLLPYYQSHQEIQPIVDMTSRLEQIKLLFSRIYPYNSLILHILYHNFAKEHGINGYTPLSSEIIRPAQDRQPNRDKMPEPAPDYLRMLEEMISDSKRLGIHLLLVASPHYKSNIFIHADIVKKLAESNQIAFIDYNVNDNYRNHPEWFHDAGHLSDAGAKVFSLSLANKLRDMKVTVGADRDAAQQKRKLDLPPADPGRHLR